jgi:hypothetical protein
MSVMMNNFLEFSGIHDSSVTSLFRRKNSPTTFLSIPSALAFDNVYGVSREMFLFLFKKLGFFLYLSAVVLDFGFQQK